MNNSESQKIRRKNKEKDGWKYFSVQVPLEFYIELKKFYLNWKINNVGKSK